MVIKNKKGAVLSKTSHLRVVGTATTAQNRGKKQLFCMRPLPEKKYVVSEVLNYLA